MLTQLAQLPDASQIDGAVGAQYLDPLMSPVLVKVIC